MKIIYIALLMSCSSEKLSDGKGFKKNTEVSSKKDATLADAQGIEEDRAANIGADGQTEMMDESQFPTTDLTNETVIPPESIAGAYLFGCRVTGPEKVGCILTDLVNDTAIIDSEVIDRILITSDGNEYAVDFTAASDPEFLVEFVLDKPWQDMKIKAELLIAGASYVQIAYKMEPNLAAPRGVDLGMPDGTDCYYTGKAALGICWFHAFLDKSCDEHCTTLGLQPDPLATWAEDQTNCGLVSAQFGNIQLQAALFNSYGAMGCFTNAQGAALYYTTTTSSSTKYSGMRRFCACK
jgi:hypothetical protein